jgi:hypothetical protein
MLQKLFVKDKHKKWNKKKKNILIFERGAKSI